MLVFFYSSCPKLMLGFLLDSTSILAPYLWWRKHFLLGISSGFLGGTPISLHFFSIIFMGWLLGPVLLKLMWIISWFAVGDFLGVECDWQRRGVGPLGGKRVWVSMCVEELVEIAEEPTQTIMRMYGSPCLGY